MMEYIVLKTSADFVDWQTQNPNKTIIQIQPIVSNIDGDISHESDIGMSSNIGVFVLYMEKKQ